jgi:hypothetical protein
MMSRNISLTMYNNIFNSENRYPCKPSTRNLTSQSTFCRLCATSVNILSSSSLHSHYMFRPYGPSSGVQVVVMKDCAAHCNAVMLI